MKIYVFQFTAFLILFLGIVNVQAQGVVDVEFNSSTLTPHIRLTETSTTDYSRIYFNNTGSPDRWSISSRLGTVGNDVIGFYYNGNARLVCNEESVAGGGVGIGTSTPEDLLHVVGGDVQFSGTNPRLFIINDGAADARIGFGDNGAAADGGIWYDSSEDIMNFGTSTTNGDIQVQGNGRVGINTDPNDGDGQLMIQANSGTTSTPVHLDLRENNNSDFARLRFSQFSSTDVMGYWDVAGKGEPAGSPSGDPILNFFYGDGTTGTNILSLDGDDEKVGINDSSPEYTLDVSHESGVPSATTATGNGINLENSFTGNSWQFYAFSSGNMTIYNNEELKGTFDATSGNYTASSDLRLKKNVATLNNQLDIIKQLRPTSYQYNSQSSDRSVYGLIAQEVQQVMPDIVINMNEEGDDEILGVSYTELIPVLIAGMQEQQTMIEQIQSQNELLRQQIQLLQSQVKK